MAAKKPKQRASKSVAVESKPTKAPSPRVADVDAGEHQMKIMEGLGKIGEALHAAIQAATELEKEIKASEAAAQRMDEKNAEYNSLAEKCATLQVQYNALLADTNALEAKKKELTEEVSRMLSKFRT